MIRTGYTSEQIVLVAHHMKGELMGAEVFERVLHATSISERRWRQHMGKRVLSSNPLLHFGCDSLFLTFSMPAFADELNKY
jgi:hypothetical protein